MDHQGWRLFGRCTGAKSVVSTVATAAMCWVITTRLPSAPENFLWDTHILRQKKKHTSMSVMNWLAAPSVGSGLPRADPRH